MHWAEHMVVCRDGRMHACVERDDALMLELFENSVSVFAFSSLLFCN